MGVPRASRGEAAYRFQPELQAFAKDPNVVVKATGQDGYPEGAAISLVLGEAVSDRLGWPLLERAGD
jgi:hypothetical protein